MFDSFKNLIFIAATLVGVPVQSTNTERVLDTWEDTEIPIDGFHQKIKKGDDLDKNEGYLETINLRHGLGKKEDDPKLRVSVPSADIKIETIDGVRKDFIEHGRYWDRMRIKGLWGKAGQIDAITLMRSDVSRALEGLSDDQALGPVLSGDNLHVANLDISAKNLQAGDLIKIGDVILYATHNVHYACNKFLKRFGREVHDFINSDGRYYIENCDYDSKLYNSKDDLSELEERLNQNDSEYPEESKSKLGILHRLRGVRLAILRPGHLVVGSKVQIFRASSVSNLSFECLGEELSITPTEADTIRNIVGSLDVISNEMRIAQEINDSANHAAFLNRNESSRRNQ